MGYGAVVRDGYGVSYNPHPEYLLFCISSFSDCQTTSSEQFEAALVDTLSVMREICTKWNMRRSSSLGKMADFFFSFYVVTDL